MNEAAPPSFLENESHLEVYCLPLFHLQHIQRLTGEIPKEHYFPVSGIYQAKEFYKPDYENSNSKIPDNRTTIYWNPEIKIDSTGKAKVSFYNSDLKGKL